MAQVRSWAGLDVHARRVLAVTMDAESGELRSARLPGDTAKVVKFVAGLSGPTRVPYEAGPTGYGLARALHAAGVGCVVAAPGKIERPSQDQIKTDQRDAERVLRLLMMMTRRTRCGSRASRRRRYATGGDRPRCGGVVRRTRGYASPEIRPRSPVGQR